MGPTTLFDKSFIQGLTVDESVWFDHFFSANVSPLFFVETLADLSKSVRSGRTPEEEVGIIASKFPELGSAPCSHHTEMCVASLMGNPIPMNGQIPVARGRPAAAGDKRGVVFDHSPEAEAFGRWQRGEFRELERRVASRWRAQLASLDLSRIAKGLNEVGIDGKTCKSLDDAHRIASDIVKNPDKPFQKIELAFELFGIRNPKFQREVMQRWHIYNFQPLASYAPYAAHVFTVDLFFHIAIAASLISADRPSNRVDIAYLYYLPFCRVFISQDRLHRRCAPAFLREDQVFVWGTELKQDLGKINDHFSSLPQAVKELGVIKFAGTPPRDGDFLTTKIWDQVWPGWNPREGDREERKVVDPDKEAELVSEFRKLTDAPPIPPEKLDFDPRDADNLTIERKISRKKGQWWQVPKGLKEDE